LRSHSGIQRRFLVCAFFFSRRAISSILALARRVFLFMRLS
jgi:hypothetical protein